MRIPLELRRHGTRGQRKLLRLAYKLAAQGCVPCALTIENLGFPNTYPVTLHSAVTEMVDPALGFVPGNVIIISAVDSILLALQGPEAKKAKLEELLDLQAVRHWTPRTFLAARDNRWHASQEEQLLARPFGHMAGQITAVELFHTSNSMTLFVATLLLGWERDWICCMCRARGGYSQSKWYKNIFVSLISIRNLQCIQLSRRSWYLSWVSCSSSTCPMSTERWKRVNL